MKKLQELFDHMCNQHGLILLQSEMFDIIDIVNKIKMETKYSKEQFEGFTHRFIVKLKIDNDWINDTNIDLYSNSESYQKLEDFINEKKSEKVIAFDIIHRTTKEQDEMASKLIDETLSGL